MIHLQYNYSNLYYNWESIYEIFCRKSLFSFIFIIFLFLFVKKITRSGKLTDVKLSFQGSSKFKSMIGDEPWTFSATRHIDTFDDLDPTHNFLTRKGVGLNVSRTTFLLTSHCLVWHSLSWHPNNQQKIKKIKTQFFFWYQFIFSAQSSYKHLDICPRLSDPSLIYGAEIILKATI